MRAGLAILAVSFALGACTTTSAVSPGEAAAVPADRVFLKTKPEAEGTGAVVVTRDTGFIGAGCRLGLFVNGDLAASFEPGETLRMSLAPGEYLVGAGFPKGAGLCALHSGEPRELSIVLAAGNVRYYRIGVRAGDGPMIEPTSQR
ncbi:hypothetical protein ACQ4P5_20180 [Ralstonia sp. L16]|uniref:hypothetical protein n=1 Tax=Ralstonia sp. L16 TaxID=3423950 RepID=UPI003F7B0CB6